jgi:excisionase family DNA binding protein
VEQPTLKLDRPEQFAERVEVSRAQVYKWLADGMPSLKLGRSRRIDPAEGLAWLREQNEVAS